MSSPAAPHKVGEDDDDDFVYTGSGGQVVKSHYDEVDEQTFSANFEFMQTQSFSTEGFESSSTVMKINRIIGKHEVTNHMST
jgi:hypothetical protein